MRWLVSILLLLLITTTSWGAVAFDAVSNSTCIDCSSLTFSHTTSTGSNRAIAVGACATGPSGTTQPAVTSVTYAGVSLTSKRTEGTTYHCDLWSLPDGTQPATGANNVVITLAGTTTGLNNRLRGAAVTFTGVDQTTAWTSSNNGNNGNSSTSTLTISASGADDMGIDFVCHGTDVTTTTETDRLNIDDGAAACNSLGVATAAGGDTSFSWSHSGADTWIIIGGALKASGGAPPPDVRRVYVY